MLTTGREKFWYYQEGCLCLSLEVCTALHLAFAQPHYREKMLHDFFRFSLYKKLYFSPLIALLGNYRFDY
jgi:hypothetical protein